MNIIVLEPPVEEPVSLLEVYDHLRLDPDEDSPPTHPQDDLLERLILTAREYCEAITKRALLEQRLLLAVDRFPQSCRGYIELLRPPLIELHSVKFYDEDRVLQTVSSSHYFTTVDLVPRLMFTEDFPSEPVYAANDSVRIEYSVGYGSVALVPESVKQAMKMIIADLYNNPEAQTYGQLYENKAADFLLKNLVITTF